jgi:hypothetical protein
MTREVEYVDGSGGNVQKASSSKGFVQAAVTYTVRDDLTVTPMSNISSITLFSTLRVTDFSALREKTVWLGYNEVTDGSVHACIYNIITQIIVLCLFLIAMVFAGSADS